VLGFRAVGKTTLTTHFVEGRFVERYDPTIENTFQKTIRFKKVQFFTEIVDSAGMDEYSRLSRNASVGVHGYLLLYAANSRNSFSKVQAIDDLLLEMHGGSENVARVLVATMIDLDGERTVSYEEGQALADSRNIPFIECSAKENINVTEVFTTLIREIERDNGTLDAEVRAASKRTSQSTRRATTPRRALASRDLRDDLDMRTKLDPIRTSTHARTRKKLDPHAHTRTHTQAFRACAARLA